MKRIWEIDALRGIAILMMVIYHVLFDLTFLNIYNIEVFQGFWKIFARTCASLFIFVVGLSLVIANKTPSFKKTAKRSLKVLFWALIITLTTFLFYREGTVYFGILHLIGISILAGFFFLRFTKLNIMLGTAIIILGIYLKEKAFAFPHLLLLGFPPNNFYTLDYFPLLPWFGLVLLGIASANMLYKKRESLTKETKFSKPLEFLGRHSLLIYVLHQPVIFAVFFFSGLSPLPF